MSLTDVTYSGCPCPQPSWYIETEKLDLDFAANEGVARNGVLYFKNVPILASPYLSFPLKKERKSGFLLPTFGATSNTGIDYSQPYYFNLAPNMDMTAQLRGMSKHGLHQLNPLSAVAREDKLSVLLVSGWKATGTTSSRGGFACPWHARLNNRKRLPQKRIIGQHFR